ncbi:MAG: PAS domain S-box protein [Chloroflexi bacterium]|nr:PAS domain S-box protein [Chloroflexota bacterium]
MGDGKTPEATRSESGERRAGNGAPDVAARHSIAPAISTEALSACVEAAPLAMLIIDRGGGIVLVNARAEQMFGYGREELIGQSIEVLVPAALRDTHVKHRAGYSADPPVRPMGSGRALAARRKDGSEFVAEIGLGFARFDGEAIAFATVIDITERKQTEDTLRESEQRFRSLYELASDAFLNVLPDGEIIDANNAAAKLLGYTAGELRGLTGADIIAPEVFEETEQAWREQLAQRGQFLVDTLWVRKDGSRVPVAVSGKRDQQQLQLIGRDITERKEAEETLAVRGRQQAAVAQLGLHALMGIPLDTLMDEAVATLADVLGVEYAKVLELQEGGGTLLLRAGVGWNEGLVGSATVESERASQAGYTLMSEQPVVVENTAEETRFTAPPLLAQHGVVAGMSVVIYCQGQPWGVLGSHTRRSRPFSDDDVSFLQAVANLLGAELQRKQAEEALQHAREELEGRAERRLEQGESYGLTFREWTVLYLVAEGKADKEIAAVLGIRPLTVSKHVSNILGKMDAHSRTEAGTRAVREGLLG